MAFRTDAVTVVVPATSANLGPGFDSLGLALSLEDEVTARVADSGVRVTVEGEGAGEVSSEDNLIVTTMMKVFAELQVEPPPGVELLCRNRIPHARGLGSSSAAIVAGILLANALLADGPLMGTQDMLRLAARMEGHPDNVAPCLLGGFTIAWTDEDGAHAVRLPVAARVRAVLYIPAERGLTAAARAALPATVPHRDAAFNAARAALLVHAITTDPALLFAATADKLHQDYRAEGMPATATLLQELRRRGVAACVSGAGPSVLVLYDADRRPDLPDPLAGWDVRSLSVSSVGARMLSARHAEAEPVAAGPPG